MYTFTRRRLLDIIRLALHLLSRTGPNGTPCGGRTRGGGAKPSSLNKRAATGRALIFSASAEGAAAQVAASLARVRRDSSAIPQKL
ncbi:hypothetical protein FOA52_000174 [Chlamydomonas sp. UWO 241]|nr:hypothetical protein FOA52_000174 [Chlamydomonas sp. UWO 241]